MNASPETPAMAKPVPGYARARSILGADFITPEEVTKVRPNIVYSDEQIALLVKTIPSTEVLQWCRGNCYAVIPAPPTAMSTLEIWALEPELFHSKTGWHIDQRLASKDKTSLGWLKIQKAIVANLISEAWSKQNKRLEIETMSNPADTCWFITTYFKMLGFLPGSDS